MEPRSRERGDGQAHGRRRVAERELISPTKFPATAEFRRVHRLIRGPLEGGRCWGAGEILAAASRC